MICNMKNENWSKVRGETNPSESWEFLFSCKLLCILGSFLPPIWKKREYLLYNTVLSKMYIPLPLVRRSWRSPAAIRIITHSKRNQTQRAAVSANPQEDNISIWRPKACFQNKTTTQKPFTLKVMQLSLPNIGTTLKAILGLGSFCIYIYIFKLNCLSLAEQVKESR
jgi:hypothetical protein